MPTTEFVVAPLKPGIEIGEPDNEGTKAIKECGDTLNKADGLQRVRIGTQVENPSNFQMAVIWDHIDKHKEFMAKDTYKPFLERFLSVAAGHPEIIHADMVPEGAVNKAFEAPVTEIATFYFGGEPPADYIDQVLKFGEAVNKEQPEGYHGSAVGLTHEDIEKDGHKGKGAVLTIGWSSVDAHMKFRETETFKSLAPVLRNGVKTANVVHVAFLTVEQ
ncbi:hypothetical protein PRZ48_012000 [Zasmidium cellare]|uniref:ABM domain-containing protein n=1 Tax=Zasmidium cellare TaxID=395010 RepID=A0ABR0E893_ZASCE|nr:hypothetical protein PRZ48_012000 [Zasmidium cellare]